MAYFVTSNKRKVVVAYGKNLTVEADIASFLRLRFTYVVRLAGVNNISSTDLVDFALALKMVARAVGNVIGKVPKSGGFKIDPDEPMQIPNTDWTVTYRVFPHDPRYTISFTKFYKTGETLASIPPFSATNDLPSVMQLANVAGQAANLMRSY